MGNGQSRLFEDPGYHPRLTDKQVAELRGVYDRGLSNHEPAIEVLASFYNFADGKVFVPLDSFPFVDLDARLDALALEELTAAERFARLDLGEIRRFAKLAPYYVSFRDKTAALLKVSAIAEKLATNELYDASPETFFDIVGLIVTICETIGERTKARYKFFADSQEYLPLDRAVLAISPIKDYRNWKSLYEQKKRVMAGKALVQSLVPVDEQPIGIKDDEAWQRMMDEVDRRLDSDRVTAEIASGAIGDMPEVNRRIKNLKILTFADVEAQTRARYPREKRDRPLYDYVELMMYNSVLSVLLDKEGNPAFLRGFPYGFLIPDAGVPMQRQMPPKGLYASTGKLADYHIKIEGREVKSILFGGVGALIEPGAGFSWEHELHTRLQLYIDFNGFHVVPVIVVPEAFSSDEFSFSEAYSQFGEITERTGKYLYAEVVRRLSTLYENWEEVLVDLTEQIIKDIIVDRVKTWARNYIIKKIGKKFIPGLNLISLISELADKDEIDRTRAAVAAIVMSVKSKRTDDLTISSKVLAKIGIDKVQEAAVQAIQNRAKKVLVRKVESALKPKAKAQAKAKGEATDQPPPQQQPDAPTPTDPKTTKKADAPPASDLDKARGTTDRRNQRGPTREDFEQGRKIAQEIQKAQAKAKADADPAVDSKKTDGTSTDGTSTQAKGKGGRGTHVRKDPEEPPVPPRIETTKQALEFFDKNKDKYPDDIRQRIEAELEKGRARKPDVTVKAVAGINADIQAENAKGGKYDLIPTDIPADKKLQYLKDNRSKYPEAIREKINAEIKTAHERYERAGISAVMKIDAAIREDHARVLSIHYGVPIEKVVRRPRIAKGDEKGEDTSGSDQEKINISARTGTRPALSAVSRTKDGQEVQLDDLHFDENGKVVAREYKATLEIKGKPEDVQQREIQERMDRHGRWAQDYDARYEWVYHSKADGDKMVAAKAALIEQANNPKTTKAVRDALVERYRRIEIIPDPYDE